MKSLFSGCSLGLALTVSALAADAVFSPDGKSITLVPPAGAADQLWQVDVATKSLTKVPVELPDGEDIESLALGAEGELLLRTDKAIYVRTAKGTQKVCDTQGVPEAGGLAVVPPKTGDVADCLIITGKDQEDPQGKSRICYARKPSGRNFVPVFGRRIEEIGEGGFTSNGRYVFLADHALWEGFFWRTPDATETEREFGLHATAIAELGYCDSNFSNTGEYTLGESIALAGNHVYLVLRGRHGSDLLIRVALPAEPAPKDGTDSAKNLEAHYAYRAKVFSSVKVLETDERVDLLAAANVKGEERVFYATHHPGHGSMQLKLWSSRGEELEIGDEIKEEE